jgi:hypothetical protein
VSDRPHVHIVKRVNAQEPEWRHHLPNPNPQIQAITVDLRVYWPSRINEGWVRQSFERVVNQARQEMDEWFDERSRRFEQESDRDSR